MLKTLTAALMAGALMTGPALGESFPTWDINKSALSQVQGMNALYMYDAQHNENMEGVKEYNSYPQEQIFKAYVAWETHCRDYTLTHWASYSEYVQLASIHWVVVGLVGQIPSYCALLLTIGSITDPKGATRNLGVADFKTGTWKP
jgi:hypothetical protein